MLLAGSCALHKWQFAASDQSPTVRVEYEGAGAVSRIVLSRRIEGAMLGLSKNPERAEIVTDAAHDLERLYRSFGFPDVKIGHEVERVKRDGITQSLRVTFRIHEGPEVTVEALEIQGNHSIRTDELKKLWRQRFGMSLGLGQPLFVRDDIDQLRKLIGARYQNDGYLGVRVDEPVIERQKGKAIVTLRVREGPLYSIDKVTVADALQGALGDELPPSPAGKAYSTRDVDAFRRKIRSTLREAGYSDPEVRVVIGGREGETTVTVRIDGKPGAKRRVAEVVARGDETAHADLIVDAFGFDAGDPFKGSIEDEGLRKLQSSGLFRKIEVKHEVLDDGRLRIAVEVVELPSTRFTTDLGYGTWERVRFGIRFEERNLFGTGKELAVAGRIHTRGYATSATLTDPDLFRSGTSLSVGGSLSRQEQPSYTDKVLEGTVALIRPIAGPVTAQLGYTFQDHGGSNVEAIDPAAGMAGFEQGFVFAELGYDARPGHHERVRIDVADSALGGQVDYVRARFESTVMVPITDDLTLVARGETGLLWPGAGSGRVPVQERFFAGGEDTVRSFREDKLGPKDAVGEALGGEFRNLVSAELRYRIARPLEAAVFFDAGNVGRNVSAWGLSDLRFGLGAGLIYRLPTGLPVRLDAAINPDRRINEETWVLHLRIGQLF